MIIALNCNPLISCISNFFNALCKHSGANSLMKVICMNSHRCKHNDIFFFSVINVYSIWCGR